MRILWIVNSVLPAPSKELGLSVPVNEGWILGVLENLKLDKGITLAISTAFSIDSVWHRNIEDIDYYLLPSKNKLQYDPHLERYWKQVVDEFKPDAIHIQGTEFSHGLACMRALPDQKYIISIQGLVSVCSRYYYSGISFRNILRNTTFRDLIRFDTMFQAKNKFVKRGVLEKDYLKRAQNFIGRTNWDYIHTKSINPKGTYHFGNETLRNAFYTAEKWTQNNCIPHTIFLSQGGYPIKGLHMVIEAAAMLVKEFPNLKIKIAGSNIIKSDSFFDKIKLNGYGKFLKRLIKKGKLEENIVFLGILDEKKMIQQYLDSNIFVCPSSIENSCNSIGEAQLLGVPVIASYVGGNPELVADGVSGLVYRFEEVEMLAEKIRMIFNDEGLAVNLSLNGIKAAAKRHNGEVNIQQLKNIYTSVIN
jgi:glycosyltransferase involved in cell wall biosynthesis